MIKQIIRDWKDAKRSVKFWNIIAVICLIFPMFFGEDFIVASIGLSSILAIMTILFSDTSDYDWPHFWVIVTPVGILILGVVNAVEVFGWVYENTIERFNNWLNK